MDLTAEFDEDASIVDWKPSGIWMSASSRTFSYLYLLDPATKKVMRVAPESSWNGNGFTLSKDATMTAYVASSATNFPEVYVVALAPNTEHLAPST